MRMAGANQNPKRELPDQLVKLLKMDAEFSKVSTLPRRFERQQ